MKKIVAATSLFSLLAFQNNFALAMDSGTDAAAKDKMEMNKMEMKAEDVMKAIDSARTSGLDMMKDTKNIKSGDGFKYVMGDLMGGKEMFLMTDGGDILISHGDNSIMFHKGSNKTFILKKDGSLETLDNDKKMLAVDSDSKDKVTKLFKEYADLLKK
jgi:hypothetical protein